MAQIIEAGYKTYSRKYCVYVMGRRFGCPIEFNFLAHGRKSQYSDKQYKLWKPMHHELTAGSGSQVNVEFFGKCRKKALIGWHSVLEPLQKQLLEKHRDSEVNLGKEFIYSRRIGWCLNRYGSIKVLKRMWTIVESGVHNKLLNISYKYPVEKVFKPRRVTIQANIFVQFVFHSFGLLFALIVFIVELRKVIGSFLCALLKLFCFLIGNFIKQFRKAFSLGIKCSVNTIDQLLNQLSLLLYCNSCQTKVSRHTGRGRTTKMFIPRS